MEVCQTDCLSSSWVEAHKHRGLNVEVKALYNLKVTFHCLHVNKYSIFTSATLHW